MCSTLNLSCCQQYKKPPALAAISVAEAESCTYGILKQTDVEPVLPASILGWCRRGGFTGFALLEERGFARGVAVLVRSTAGVFSYLVAGCLLRLHTAQRLGCLCGVSSCAHGVPCTAGQTTCCSAHSSFAWLCYCSCINRVCCLYDRSE